jgi:hypothetical protein
MPSQVGGRGSARVGDGLPEAKREARLPFCGPAGWAARSAEPAVSFDFRPISEVSRDSTQ